jgi:hypothetical protein
MLRVAAEVQVKKRKAVIGKVQPCDVKFARSRANVIGRYTLWRHIAILRIVCLRSRRLGFGLPS